MGILVALRSPADVEAAQKEGGAGRLGRIFRVKLNRQVLEKYAYPIWQERRWKRSVRTIKPQLLFLLHFGSNSNTTSSTSTIANRGRRETLAAQHPSPSGRKVAVLPTRNEESDWLKASISPSPNRPTNTPYRTTTNQVPKEPTKLPSKTSSPYP